MEVKLLEVLEGKYPAKAHAKRVKELLISRGGDGKGVLYLEGQKQKMNEDNDQEAPFRQRRNFFYLTGCELPNSYLTYDMSNDKLTLFIPPIDPDDVVWSGLPLQPDEALAKFDVDAVLTSNEVVPHLANSDELSQTTIYAIGEQVSSHVTFLGFTHKDVTLLRKAIEACRVVKDDYEIAMLKHANDVSAEAHIAAMRAAPKSSNERELYAIFLKECISRGLYEQGYHGIFAAGTNASTLHYIKNDSPIQPGQLLLLDAGAENRCYTADITRTFPVSGRFSTEAKEIYTLVLRMQTETMALIKAGVLWDTVHELAHKVAIAGLLSLGILKGHPDEIFTARASVPFFPHGLGHYLGMDTHDCGGQPNYKDPDPMFRYLRVREELPEGCVVTCEPGIYFSRFVLGPALEDEKVSRFIDRDVLERYWQVGGVRIEDNLFVTKDGYVNLTTVPKTVEDLEALIQGV